MDAIEVERAMGAARQDGETRPTVVGIGASAGGLAALKGFFQAVPEDCGVCFVVVMHLSPEHESHLASLLQPFVRMPVMQVTETVAVERNRVFVIPPNANIEAVDTHLRLAPLEGSRHSRAPIDRFFRTLGRTHDGNSVGIILSGTGSDGALGIREIKEKNGLTIVQDPNEAEFDGMPVAAIATGLVDLVLPSEEMPAACLGFARTTPRVELPVDESALTDDTRTLLQKVFAQVRARTGRDFSRYKASTILRRMTRRMQLHGIEDLPGYLDLLRRESHEARALADDLLITVTNFFRDREVFEYLERQVVPRILERKRGARDVRIWSVGCATGEEAYSLAILFLEAAAKREHPLRIQIFASDLHDRSLARARDGFYAGAIEADVSAERLSRYFQKEAGGYRVRKEVRDLVIFAPHNLLRDPPFSRLDLVACRNVLIYLQRDIHREVVELFHYALQPEGLLVLGTAESVEGSDLFVTENKSLCVFRRRNLSAREPRLPVFPLVQARFPMEVERILPPQSSASYGALHQRMVEQYAPPSLLLSADDKVVHLSEHAGRYLVHPGGELTSAAVKLVREELRVELRSALHLARERKQPVRSGPVRMQFGTESRKVSIDVQPAPEPELADSVLVIFSEVPEDAAEPRAHDGSPEVSARSAEMQAELDLARSRLQKVIDEYETSQEEMKSSNEELLSANEELRSTLEELETSKEELQSMNEELQTVNQENRHKVEELAQLSADLQNLLAATEIATLFLDRELRIMRFTPKLGDLFNVRTTDRSRPISDITHRLGYDALLEDAKSVLARLVPVEREVQDKEGRWYLTRVLPYRTTEDQIAGVVITFVEVTERKRSEEALRASEETNQLVLRAAEAGTWRCDVASGVVHLDGSARSVLGLSEAEVPRGDLWKMIHPADRDRFSAMIGAAFEGGEGKSVLADDYRVRRPDGALRWIHVRGQMLVRGDGEGRRAIEAAGVVLDATARRQAEEELRQTTAELEEEDERKEQFLATLGHELRNPLAALDSAMRILERGMEPPAGLVTTMSGHIHQLTSLVNDLLDISRVTRGKIALRTRRVDLRQVIDRAAETVAAPVRAKEQELVLPPQDELAVVGDPTRLEQIVCNLLSNASKYSARGTRIGVTLERDGRDAVLTVRDQGRGLWPEQCESIFQLFTQADPGSGGLGIGLALVRSLAELHGGTVEAASDGPGTGSTFTVRLPIGRVDDPELRPAVRPTEAEKLPWRARVLIVDDLRDSADMLALLLRGAGAETRCAYTGEDGVRLFLDWKPDVALVDIGLPDVTGYEVGERIRNAQGGAETLLLAVTGFGDSGAEARVMAAGFDARLVKPIDHERLHAYLTRFHAERRLREDGAQA